MAEEEEKKGNPNGFVTHSEFRPVVEDVNMIKLALFGKDMRGGIVREIGELKNTINTNVRDLKNTIKNLNAVTTYRVVKEIVVPITLAVITAFIVSKVL